MDILRKVLLLGAACLLPLPSFAAQPDSQKALIYSDLYSIARGGRLYDNWFKEKGLKPPTQPHPAYPPAGKFRGKKGADWRCKECHGWDYLGVEGVYGKGKHLTGFPGIRDAYRMTPKKLAKILSDEFHGYGPGTLSAADVYDLATFVARGTFPMDHYIDFEKERGMGSVRRGREYYQTVCVGCHGLDGKGEETPPLGKLARENPWEVMHKILNGQPGEDMPALRAFGVQPAADIVTYLQEEMPVK
ncbi:MAG: hypothetical protein D6720_02930 [Gammaproteobacteria bacterium]|nr:MAG: hypothetical protein D6720_02930 [Gammaproteobacteria bacterium]